MKIQGAKIKKYVIEDALIKRHCSIVLVDRIVDLTLHKILRIAYKLAGRGGDIPYGKFKEELLK